MHVAGNWVDEIGNIKKCRAEFIKHPCKHHLFLGLRQHMGSGTVLHRKKWHAVMVRYCRWIDQVENLIKLKQENPYLRIRSAEQLGPSITVSLQQMMTSTVKGPAIYCVEPEVYAKLTQQQVPEQLVSENIDGAMMQVVS